MPASCGEPISQHSVQFGIGKPIGLLIDSGAVEVDNPPCSP
jgi:hypothetical protein